MPSKSALTSKKCEEAYWIHHPRSRVFPRYEGNEKHHIKQKPREVAGRLFFDSNTGQMIIRKFLPLFFKKH
ncbi:MAG: hypothetical protein PSX81_03220 [bacterium]|nr:hypothetical protein [bacterium]